MGLFRSIVVFSTLALLTLPCGVGAFGAVLCIETTGQAELEVHGCDCISTGNPGRTGEVDGAILHGAATPSDESCDPCVDIPIAFGTDRFESRFVRAKAQEVKSPLFVQALPSAAVQLESSIRPSSDSHSSSGYPIDSGFVPLRI